MLSAEQYCKEHWIKRQVWNNLKNEKHQIRFQEIASRCIGQTCADVGCACGHSTNYLKGFYPSFWTGFDFCKEVIDQANQLFPVIDFHYLPEVKDLKDIPMRYDSIICSEVIEHCEDPALLVNCCIKIAKQRVIITTPSKKVNDPGHVRIYDESSLLSLAQNYERRVDHVFPFYYFVIEVGK